MFLKINGRYILKIKLFTFVQFHNFTKKNQQYFNHYSKALDVRLNEMARGFEEATIDKNNQEEKAISMEKQLETAARLRKVSQLP